MANWQMHSVGELGAKSYVAREKLNAAAFSAFLMDPAINNPVRHPPFFCAFALLLTFNFMKKRSPA